MNRREKQLLQLVMADIKAGRRWDDRVLSGEPKPGQQVRITWEEMLWLSEFEKAAFVTRAEAALIVDDVLFREGIRTHIHEMALRGKETTT